MKSFEEASRKALELEAQGHKVFAVVTNGKEFELVIMWKGHTCKDTLDELNYARECGYTEV